MAEFILCITETENYYSWYLNLPVKLVSPFFPGQLTSILMYLLWGVISFNCVILAFQVFKKRYIINYTQFLCKETFLLGNNVFLLTAWLLHQLASMANTMRLKYSITQQRSNFKSMLQDKNYELKTSSYGQFTIYCCQRVSLPNKMLQSNNEDCINI